MKYADANVVLDFCALNPARSERARRTVAAQMEPGPMFVTEAVLAECFWVLSDSYGFPPAQCASMLERVLGSTDFAYDTEHQALAMRLKIDHPSLDIADCLLAARALAGDTVITHDSRLGRLIELELKGNGR